MDTINPIQFVFSFLFVIGLIGLMAFGMKRWGNTHKLFGQQWFKAQPGGGRLEVVEVRYIDPRRRLALIRRDSALHLLLLADGRELVIESGIEAGMMGKIMNDEKISDER